MATYKGKLRQKGNNGNDVLYPETSADMVTGLATVATSGSYNDLSNKPTIPTAASQVNALPNYSLSISTSGGNPREVKFVRVNYTNFTDNFSAYFKIGAMCSHGNGSSYTFLEDIIIGVTRTGAATCTVYKQVQNAQTYTVDSHTVHFGDVYWVVDTTNKYVDFYIICGQYATMNFTPFTAIGSTTKSTSDVVQSTGSAVLYSSGTRVWTTLGNGSLYAKTTDLPTKVSQLTNDSGFTSNVGTVTSVNNVSPVDGNVSISFPSITVSSNGGGNSVTEIAVDSSDPHKINITKGSTFLTSHQSLANYVTLDGAQTITGLKTFSKRPLSKDIYTKLGYIRSNATSSTVFPYIRTGVKRGVDYTNSEILSCVLDGYFTASQTYGFCGYDSGGQLGQANGKWSTEAGSSNVSALTRATVTQVLNFPSSYDRLYINGSQIANRTISSASNHAQSADYPLFVAYNGNFTYNPAKLVMYSFKMYIGDYATSPSTATLIRDFIPAKDPNGNIGLFDLVHQKFYKNSGNENFVAGEEVETFGIDASLLTSYDVAKVAMTNDYADLDNKPSIPTVNNGTLTIQKNGTTVATFTANQSGNSTANIDLSGYATTGYVDTAIQGIGNPMVFKGSLGTGGTITTLPAAASGNKGYTYKVITAGTYQSLACKVGDVVVSDGTSWTLIPSGDEPSGTVTSVGLSAPTGFSVSGSPVTGSGTLALSFAEGYSLPTTTKQTEWDNKANPSDIKVTNATVSNTGSGNAVTSVSISNGQIVATKGTTFLTSHQSLSNYVTLNGAQEVSGKKSFTQKPVFKETTVLPSGYQQVKYITASGTQYIDTGYKQTTEKMKVEFACSFPYPTGGMSLFGSNSNYDLVPYSYSNYAFSHWVGTSGSIVPVTYDPDYNEATYILDNGSLSLNLNGATYTGTYSGTIINNYNFFIFGKNGGGSSGERGNGYRLYFLKLYDNGTLVRNLVPCYRESDNEIGLYDLVGNTFYPNSGSGTFAKGGKIGESPFATEEDLSLCVKSVNNTSPDANGNVSLAIPSAVDESTVSGWGFTKNAGTVTSVRVQAGTGLSSSTSTAQSSSLNTTISIASGYKLPTTTEATNWNNKMNGFSKRLSFGSTSDVVVKFAEITLTSATNFTTDMMFLIKGQIVGRMELSVSKASGNTYPTINIKKFFNAASGTFLNTSGTFGKILSVREGTTNFFGILTVDRIGLYVCFKGGSSTSGDNVVAYTPFEFYSGESAVTQLTGTATTYTSVPNTWESWSSASGEQFALTSQIPSYSTTSSVTSGSSSLVTSGGVYTALQGKQDTLQTGVVSWQGRIYNLRTDSIDPKPGFWGCITWDKFAKKVRITGGFAPSTSGTTAYAKWPIDKILEQVGLTAADIRTPLGYDVGSATVCHSNNFVATSWMGVGATMRYDTNSDSGAGTAGLWFGRYYTMDSGAWGAYDVKTFCDNNFWVNFTVELEVN